MKKWDHFNNKNGVCYCCDAKTSNSVRINTRGFTQTSTSVSVCENCIDGKWIKDTYFVKIGSQLFWSVNCDYGIFCVLTPVNNKKHYEWLKNKRLEHDIERKFLDGVEFEYPNMY